MDQNPNPPFSETPEAQEYIQKLQMSRLELTPEASPLEAETHRHLMEKTRAVRQLAVTIGDTEKLIEAKQNELKQFQVERDRVSGELTGYAKLLVAAEGYRREPTPEPAPASTPPGIDETLEPQAGETPETVETPEAESKAPELVEAPEAESKAPELVEVTA